MQTIRHDDPNIRYSSVKPDGSHQLCATRPPQCAGQWWLEDNESGFRSAIESEMVTQGPLAYLWASFTASQQLIVLGSANGSASSVNLYLSDSGGGETGPLAAYKPSGDNYRLFDVTQLDPALQYSMALVYTGSNTLRIMALRINGSGTLFSPSVPKNAPVIAVATPDVPSPTSTTEPTVTLIGSDGTVSPRNHGIDGARLFGVLFGAFALVSIIASGSWYLRRRLRAYHVSRQDCGIMPSKGGGGSTQPYALFPTRVGTERGPTRDVKISAKGAEEINAEDAKSRAGSHTSTESGGEIGRALARAGLSRQALLKSLRRLYSRTSETASALDSTGSPPRYAE